LGAYLALISVAAIAALAGRQLVARVPLHRINYIGASVFGLLAVWSLFEVVKG
jgi:putative Ca2+/H+ antiporter (TMEM165/GDT1 family)